MWKGENYSVNLTTKDIAKIIRERLKQEFKECKFSVRCEYFAGGSSITVSLMEANFEVFNKQFKQDKNGRVYTEEDYKYAQLNEHTFSDDFTDGYNNGVYLTKKAWNILKKVVEIVRSYQFVDSDIQTDYYNTNFYFELTIGKWNKPFRKIENANK